MKPTFWVFVHCHYCVHVVYHQASVCNPWSTRSTQELNSQDRIGIWKCCFLRFCSRRKTSWSRVENQQQTQPTYDTGSRNWTRATFVRGERSHHWTISAGLTDTEVKVGNSTSQVIPALNHSYYTHSYFIHTEIFASNLLREKAFRILLRPIREAKRVSHMWKNRFVQSQTTV